MLCTVVCLIAVVVSVDAAASLSVPPPPDLKARAYILIDYDSGQVLAESKADDRMEPASLTKLMTLHIALEQIAHLALNTPDCCSPVAHVSASGRWSSSCRRSLGTLARGTTSTSRPRL